MSGATRKVTVHLPVALLVKAQRVTGEGVTETLRQGLEALTAAKAARDLRRLRGKIALAIDLKELRRDRR
ncbi:MAG: hypothetical protein HYR63_05960 [Proteobacteria bacterium]|nr:hypothetical protein [Pseudomonadota bacterium]MBI3497395.1 hypothetical protein [Pseudomonadota bacterium]